MTVNGDASNVGHSGNVTDAQKFDLLLPNNLSNSSWDTTTFVHKQLFGSPLKSRNDNPVQEGKRRDPYFHYNRGFRRSDNSVREAKRHDSHFRYNGEFRRSEHPVRETKGHNSHFRCERGFRSSFNSKRWQRTLSSGSKWITSVNMQTITNLPNTVLGRWMWKTSVAVSVELGWIIGKKVFLRSTSYTLITVPWRISEILLEEKNV